MKFERYIFTFVRNMERFAFFFCVLLNFAGFISGDIANYYSIYRNFSVFGDSFVIPEPMCKNTGTTCRDYEAVSVDNFSCKCKCPEDKGTFLSPNGNRWKCVDDRSLRHKASKLRKTDIKNSIFPLFTPKLYYLSTVNDFFSGENDLSCEYKHL